MGTEPDTGRMNATTYFPSLSIYTQLLLHRTELALHKYMESEELMALNNGTARQNWTLQWHFWPQPEDCASAPLPRKAARGWGYNSVQCWSNRHHHKYLGISVLNINTIACEVNYSRKCPTSTEMNGRTPFGCHDLFRKINALKKGQV